MKPEKVNKKFFYLTSLIVSMLFLVLAGVQALPGWNIIVGVGVISSVFFMEMFMPSSGRFFSPIFWGGASFLLYATCYFVDGYFLPAAVSLVIPMFFRELSFKFSK
jgi:hypothetical protein